MKIIEKYLLNSFIAPFIWCLIIFMFLYMVIDLFENMEDILKNSVPLFILFKYYLNLIPDILIKIMPLAVLLSLIYALSKLNKQNEITALRASGVSIFDIFKPFIIMGVFISLFALLINLNIVPKTNKTYKNLKNRYIESSITENKEKITENVTLYGYSDRIIFAKKFNSKTKTLNEIIILRQYKNKLIERITAEKALWENGQWHLYNSMTYYMKTNGEIYGNPIFSKEETLNIQEKPEDFLKNYTQSQFMKYEELKNYINKFKTSSSKIIRRLSIELHGKIAVAFINIIMVLIAVPFALKLNYTGTFMSIGICIGIGFCYYAINAISIALGNTGLLTPFIAVWITNFIFACIGLGLLVFLKD